MVFRNSGHDGMKFYYVKDSIRCFLGKSVQIENTWVRATQNCIGIVRNGDYQKTSMPDHQKLKTKVKMRIDQKLEFRNFDARHGRIEVERASVALNTKRGFLVPVERKRPVFEGRTMQFLAWEFSDRAPKTDHKAATPSEPSMSRGRNLSQKEVSKAKVTMVLFSYTRVDLKGTCTRFFCILSNVNSKNLNRYNKVEEQPSQKPKKSLYSQNGKSEDKGASARQAWNRRRRPREGPEPLCVSTFSSRGGTCQGGRTGLPVSGRHAVRRTDSTTCPGGALR